MKLLLPLICLFAWSQQLSAASQAAPTKLVIGIKGNTKTLDLKALKSLVTESVHVAPQNPAYGNKSMAYRGFSFQEILEKVAPGVNLADYKILVTCLDNYRPVLDVSTLSQGRALLAYREETPDPKNVSDDGLWTKLILNEKMVSPGPFYIVWDTTATYHQGWPLQIAEILLVPNADFKEFVALAPKGNYDSVVTAGFHKFVENCAVCHSVRYVGPLGKAPDLAYVTDYRSADYIQTILRTGRGAMPSFTGVLSAADVLALRKYLENSASQK